MTSNPSLLLFPFRPLDFRPVPVSQSKRKKALLSQQDSPCKVAASNMSALRVGQEILGRNCRFLIDPVPPDQIDVQMRKHCRQFCDSVASRQEYRIAEEEREEWMPVGRAGDELFCYQAHRRIHWCMFFLISFSLDL